MEEFQQAIHELINHCQKTEIDFNLVYKNAINFQETLDKPKWARKWNILLKPNKIFLALLLLGVLSLFYLQLDIISMHASAIGRILMVQVLPFYDWRFLKRERCLIKMDSLISSEENKRMDKSSKNCYYCDGITTIPKLEYSEESNLQDMVKEYHAIDAPVIIYNLSGVIFNLDHIQADFEYGQYIPCDLESNVHFPRSANVEEIFEKLSKAPFYFAHWRNCDVNGMKQFRRFFPRPDYIPVNFSPIQHSWLILSKNYKSGYEVYKQLYLRGRLGVIFVVGGNLWVRLTPIRFCFNEQYCRDIVVNLKGNEALIISDQWEIDYLIADNNVEESKTEKYNMAIILETR